MKVLLFPALLAAAIATAPPKAATSSKRWTTTTSNDKKDTTYPPAPSVRKQTSRLRSDGCWWCIGKLQPPAINPQNSRVAKLAESPFRRTTNDAAGGMYTVKRLDKAGQ